MNLFYILFIVTFSFAANGQDVEWLTDREFDFGYIPQGEAVQTSFHFKNTTSDSIWIELVRTSCGCTSPAWTEEGIGPGEIAHIKLAYDGIKFGSFRKKAKVFFVGVRRGIRLVISGEVY